MSDLIQVNRPAIIDETIDGEVVAVDLEQGSYYSIREAGVAIWQSLTEPTTPDRVVRQLARRFGQPEAELAPAIGKFIDELKDHGLVRTLSEAEAGSSPPDEAAPAEGKPVPAEVPFRLPELERFTDMEDLLLLDPVHEVDERGWPHAAPR